MKKYLSIILSALAALMPGWISAKNNSTDPYKDYDETRFMDMSLDENILTPAVGKNEHAAIKTYMTRLAQDLAKKNYIVDMTRNDEVVVVTVLSDDIFLPNDTLLSPSAPSQLTPILKLFSDPFMMKMVYSVHTDNTGSAPYNMRLSHERNNSIYDWMLDNINEDLIVIPYEMGDTDPVAANDTRDGRRENRRVEIFMIPGPKMITLARKGQLLK
ncbi:OmpA family protein [Muribaculaceae bacterium Isolate-039 (Harlan)]|jgi:outer membrane protein OmpA-like peptidoglycan-associated protein|nr:OmpA family protein [Muribaculaceae bacterium Isolate-039 (Harlan)]ROS97828.1 OmpA family protein [Muribaculaceae bacterium Isolate-077 (Janvier)]ROS99317.1 OmpA family protein [Muribaculaceae bacterium Isolate-083 (Janvier)]ROT02162.1 OmpA family protein [Muribaculaceae bacterium Isolate-084 (Janvier)]